jgi:pilus assembly protein CpaC
LNKKGAVKVRNKYTNIALSVALTFAGQANAATAPPIMPTTNNPMPSVPKLRPCTAVIVDKQVIVTLGKSTVISLEAPVTRMVVGGQPSTRVSRPTSPVEQIAPSGAAFAMGLAAPPAAPPAMAQQAGDGISDVDITLLSPTELFVLGKRAGAMNVILQSANGQCHVKDIVVTIDPAALQATLAELMPEETGIRVRGAENALVLTGNISNAIKLDEAMSLASSYGDGKKVVNMMRITAPQQVMLEVKIAEISKTLLDRLGSSSAINRSRNGGGDTFSLFSNFLSAGGGLMEALRVGRTSFNIDGQKDDGLVRVLAEPNIMAISGQQASFLSGGKIFIPVAQSNNGGGTTITLEEKEFGIGVKFTPTVLDGGRVNLKMVSEASDLSQTGSPFTTVGGVTSVLPSLSVRRADTTVQLNDGQSFVIAGLIKNNVTETIKRFPGLGEVPVLGALYRSTEFQNEQTELMFVITPRLVKPLSQTPMLPTDNHVVPSRGEIYINGSLESGSPPAATVGAERK